MSGSLRVLCLRFRRCGPTNPMPVGVSHRTTNAEILFQAPNGRHIDDFRPTQMCRPFGPFLISDQHPGPSTPAKDVSALSGLNSILSNHRFLVRRRIDSAPERSRQFGNQHTIKSTRPFLNSQPQILPTAYDFLRIEIGFERISFTKIAWRTPARLLSTLSNSSAAAEPVSDAVIATGWLDWEPR